MRSFLFGVTLAAALVLAGCGKSNSTPLSGDQKKEFSSTLESVGRTANVVKGAKRGAVALQHGAVQSPEQELESRMVSRLQEGACKIELKDNQAQSSKPSSDFEMGIRASGNQCPIFMDFNMKMTTGNQSMSIQLNGKYEVKDAEFAKLNDVTGFDFSGKGDMNISDKSMSGDFNMDGKLKSTKHGEVKIKSRGKSLAEANGSGGIGKMDEELVTTFEFPKFTVELKRTSTLNNGKEEVSYFVNSEKVTASEYRSYVTKAGILFPNSK